MKRNSWLKLLLFLMTAGSMCLPSEICAENPGFFDLVVYGSTASGVATAVSAAREGLHVVLVDPSHHVGGMVAGGLSSSDMGKQEVIGGISKEFFERVGHHYGEPIEWRFEPHVAEQVFNEMLREAKVTTIFDRRLRENAGITKENNRIAAITLEDGEVLRAKVFVDATYEGDFMVQAGVTYTWGRESTVDYGESIAGVRGRQRPDHHFNVRVSPYAADGSLLPKVDSGPKGELGQGDKKVQAYGFRMCLTNDKENEVPFPKPDNYNPHRYELLKRLIAAITEAMGHPPVMRDVMIMSKLKGNKFDINSFGGFSTDHIGASWEYPTVSYKRQAEIWKDHYEYDAGFFYFLANDPSVPISLRNEVNQYGLAKDEFTDNHNWPWQLYIREGRRMVGSYVMTQKDIQIDLIKPDSIGMGSYESDSHHVQRVPTSDGAVENEGEMYVITKPYEIPYRMIIPKKGEVDNLLVPVCFSASHVAYSTIRMEPQYMIIGQAAGVAAAIAVKDQVPVGEISIPELQKRLREEHAVLQEPVEGLVKAPQSAVKSSRGSGKGQHRLGQIMKVSEAVPTTQHLANALTLRSNPLNRPLLKALRNPHTNDARLQLWFSVPNQVVAELRESTATQTFWDFKYMDLVVADVFANTSGVRHVNLGTIPRWMFKVPPVDIPSDPAA